MVGLRGTVQITSRRDVVQVTLPAGTQYDPLYE